MFRIRKLFVVEMAHVLSASYAEECQRVHGHSYTFEVLITYPHLNDAGMVIDFKLLKQIVKPVLDRWDHKVVMQSDSRPIPVHACEVVTVDFNPTAENMAQYVHGVIYGPLAEHLPSLMPVMLTVRVHETATGWAEWKG